MAFTGQVEDTEWPEVMLKNFRNQRGETVVSENLEAKSKNLNSHGTWRWLERRYIHWQILEKEQCRKYTKQKCWTGRRWVRDCVGVDKCPQSRRNAWEQEANWPNSASNSCRWRTGTLVGAPQLLAWMTGMTTTGETEGKRTWGLVGNHIDISDQWCTHSKAGSFSLSHSPCCIRRFAKSRQGWESKAQSILSILLTKDESPLVFSLLFHQITSY